MTVIVPDGFEVVSHAANLAVNSITGKPVSVDLPKAVPIAQPTTEKTTMANKFVTIMEKIAEDIKIGFEDVVKYLPAASGLAALLFPAAAVPLATAENIVNLTQQAVVLVEQKFTAAGINSQAGAQKLATVISIVTPVVTQLLAQSGISVNATQITNIVNAVVAILNVSVVTTTP